MSAETKRSVARMMEIDWLVAMRVARAMSNASCEAGQGARSASGPTAGWPMFVGWLGSRTEAQSSVGRSTPVDLTAYCSSREHCMLPVGCCCLLPTSPVNSRTEQGQNSNFVATRVVVRHWQVVAWLATARPEECRVGRTSEPYLAGSSHCSIVQSIPSRAVKSCGVHRRRTGQCPALKLGSHTNRWKRSIDQQYESSQTPFIAPPGQTRVTGIQLPREWAITALASERGNDSN